MGKVIDSLKFTFIYDLVLPFYQMFKTANWYLKSKQIDTPHLIKQETIKDYQKKYNLTFFIETGTYLGVMINAVKNNFSKIYTIEIDTKLYKKAKQKFAKYKYIKILHGDSSKILPGLLKKINKPSLFWLDAHYSKGVTAKGAKNTPVREELTAILKHKIKNHVILIDDAESFNGENEDYPSIIFLKKYIQKSFPSLFFEVKDNIIRINPKYLSQKADKIHS